MIWDADDCIGYGWLWIPDLYYILFKMFYKILQILKANKMHKILLKSNKIKFKLRSFQHELHSHQHDVMVYIDTRWGSCFARQIPYRQHYLWPAQLQCCYVSVDGIPTDLHDEDSASPCVGWTAETTHLNRRAHWWRTGQWQAYYEGLSVCVSFAFRVPRYVSGLREGFRADNLWL